MKLIGLGELLWDLFPSGARLGGAPANFAFIALLLGAESHVVSCLGNDDLGREARRQLESHGLDTTHIQTDSDHPTGTVQVTVSANGTPAYSIVENVAWDHVRWTPDLANLARTADSVCFGTLAQRSAVTRETIRRFLDYTRPDCLRILDANCRKPFCDPAILTASLAKANVLKCSAEELHIVLAASSITASDEVTAAAALQQKYGFKLVCITRGDRGSVVVTSDATELHPGVTVEVADTVGAGDAFLAAMTVAMLNGLSLQQTSEAANHIAAWVASKPGAMPRASESAKVRLKNFVAQRHTIYEP